ncbi:ABC transporter permease subunit [Streptomyces sp. CJ_13]|uniref:ABC transporter permease n=1 Tax=Streptomyces sp. CJ_13 TaxID=2724943 RepID=UPI001BDD318D|nr:ABC transporter permease [Streptomyces sp. CJ_13]MBT1184943.1 ABC transporter permease subunit [Streptomyces sp. CJ_13]
MSHTKTVLDLQATVTTRGTALRRALRYEWCHLHALRSTWILLGAIAVLSLVAGLTTPVGLAPGTAPSSWAIVTAFQMDAVSMQLPLSAFLLLPVATGPIATELTRGTARTTWLTLASRRTAFAAKLLVGGGLGAMTALGGTLLVALSAMSALAVSGKAQPNWDQTLSGLLGYTIFMTCWPVIAASIAALLRNRVAATLMLILWPLLGERIAGILLRLVPGVEALAGWLPFGAGRAALAASADTLPAADRALVEALVGSDLSSGAGTIVFIGFAMVLAVLGAWSYMAKDVR